MTVLVAREAIFDRFARLQGSQIEAKGGKKEEDQRLLSLARSLSGIPILMVSQPGS